MSATPSLITAVELLALPDDGFRYELVKGGLEIKAFATAENGLVTMQLAGPLYEHIRARNLGVAFAQELVSRSNQSRIRF